MECGKGEGKGGLCKRGGVDCLRGAGRGGEGLSDLCKR